MFSLENFKQCPVDMPLVKKKFLVRHVSLELNQSEPETYNEGRLS